MRRRAAKVGDLLVTGLVSGPAYCRTLLIVILSGITARYGFDGLQIATLMAGIILVIMGVTKLGRLVKFIPDPVIVGFTAGIGVIIWSGQWHYRPRPLSRQLA